MADEIFAFELRLDYGEYDPTIPPVNAARPWPLRPDPFVSCRPGFALHTLRLCRNILVLNHLPENPGGVPTLAFIFRLDYQEDAVCTCLRSIQIVGCRRETDGYHQASLPPLSFDYIPFDPSQAVVQPITTANGAPLPGAVDDKLHVADLHGEGLP